MTQIRIRERNQINGVLSRDIANPLEYGVSRAPIKSSFLHFAGHRPSVARPGAIERLRERIGQYHPMPVLGRDLSNASAHRPGTDYANNCIGIKRH